MSIARGNDQYCVPAVGAPLQLSTCPLPDLSPTEILIRTTAIGLNPADVKMIDAGHRVQSWPLVPGLEGAGVIESVGRDVTRFKTGDAVFAVSVAGSRSASYQKYMVVEELWVGKIPYGWGDEEAAGVAVCFITALVGLSLGLDIPLPFLGHKNERQAQQNVQATSPRSIKSILVLGGSSALGAAAIQLLRISLPLEGTRVLTTASPKHHKHLEEYLGATKAIDRSTATLVEEIRNATPDGDGVDAIFDAVGAAAPGNDGKPSHIFDALRADGQKRYAQVWTGNDVIPVPHGVKSVLFRSRELSQVEGYAGVMSGLVKLMAEGKYKVPLPVRTFGSSRGEQDGFPADRVLTSLSDGLNLLRKGVSGEKAVIRVYK